jgi:hypothetical protein
VAYRICLPSQLAATHDVFHISELKKCIKVPTEIVESLAIEIEPDLSYTEQPIQILDTKERESPEERGLRYVRSYGIITQRKKQPGKLKSIFRKTSKNS